MKSKLIQICAMAVLLARAPGLGEVPGNAGAGSGPEVPVKNGEPASILPEVEKAATPEKTDSQAPRVLPGAAGGWHAPDPIKVEPTGKRYPLPIISAIWLTLLWVVMRIHRRRRLASAAGEAGC